MDMKEFDLTMLLLGLTKNPTVALLYEEVTYSGHGVWFTLNEYSKTSIIEKKAIATVLVHALGNRRISCLTAEEVVDAVRRFIHFKKE